MKKYLLSNRVRNAILLAILLQSVIFGIGLLVTGTFSGTVNRPYKVMESQVSEKNSLLSGYMNNVLLLSNTMEKELGRMSDKEEIQNRLTAVVAAVIFAISPQKTGTDCDFHKYPPS